MIKPEIPENEAERVKELESYQILDTLPEEDYDNLTIIASEICGTNISLVSLVDKERQWFKSKKGLDAIETEREMAFCAHAINIPEEVLIVNDARRDERFYDNPLVVGEPFVTFYAGVPLVTEKGLPLGTLCVIDDKPKELSPAQLRALKALAKQIMNLLELRKKRMELEKTVRELKLSNEELDRFSAMVAHDVKGPLNQINALVQLFKKEHFIDIEAPDGKEIIQLIGNSAATLKLLVDKLLEYSRNIHVEGEKNSSISLSELFESMEHLYATDKNIKMSFESALETIYVNRSVLERSLQNLISNAIKYNDKDILEIKVSIEKGKDEYIVEVSDNGPGIPEVDHDKIFQIWHILDKSYTRGTGLGLAIVERLVKDQGGTVSLESEIGIGSVFSFTLPS